MFDDNLVCTSKCKFDPVAKVVRDVEIADNNEDSARADAVTDEYVTVNGRQLRREDGVTFVY